MKKITFCMATLLSVFALFTSCGEKEIIAPMTGVWQCTGISGTAVGLNTPTADSKALNLLSVAFGGVGLSGVIEANYYARTGSGDLLSDASAVYNTISDVSSIKTSWQKFLTTGTFSYSGNKSDGTLTTTSKDGLVQEFTYHIDGSTMTLTESVLPSGIGDAISTVGNIIGSLFGSSSPSTTVGVVYSYKKADVSTITNLVK